MKLRRNKQNVYLKALKLFDSKGENMKKKQQKGLTILVMFCMIIASIVFFVPSVNASEGSWFRLVDSYETRTGKVCIYSNNSGETKTVEIGKYQHCDKYY